MQASTITTVALRVRQPAFSLSTSPRLATDAVAVSVVLGQLPAGPCRRVRGRPRAPQCSSAPLRRTSARRSAATARGSPQRIEERREGERSEDAGLVPMPTQPSYGRAAPCAERKRPVGLAMACPRGSPSPAWELLPPPWGGPLAGKPPVSPPPSNPDHKNEQRHS